MFGMSLGLVLGSKSGSIGTLVKDRTMVRFHGFHKSRGDLNESLSAENAEIYLF